MLPNEETLVAARPDPYIGKVIDKYKLVERLGAGGMGLVYRAEQARMDRHVAVKLLPFTLVNDQVNVKRIEREAKAMGNLRHPNIATIFDFGFSEEYQPYLVMELITGRSLGDMLHEERSLDPQRVIKVMAQAADAMDYAHKHGIIHRDLKPDNIMLDNHHTDDFVKILDFGIAKSVDEAVSLSQSQSLTRPGTVVGSPLYMSPEQCVGQRLDAKTDIYSLGVIMYEILTGLVPCKGATIYETIGKKTTEAPPPFPPQFAQFKELENLTLSCLATLKGDRPESMQAVRDMLRSMSSITLDFHSPQVTLSTPALAAPPQAQAQTVVTETPVSHEIHSELIQLSAPIVPDALPQSVEPAQQDMPEAQPYLQASFSTIQDQTEQDQTLACEVETADGGTTANDVRRVTKSVPAVSQRPPSKLQFSPWIIYAGAGAVGLVVGGILTVLNNKPDVVPAETRLPAQVQRAEVSIPARKMAPDTVPGAGVAPVKLPSPIPPASIKALQSTPNPSKTVKPESDSKPKAKTGKSKTRRQSPAVSSGSDQETQYRYGTRRASVSTNGAKVKAHLKKIHKHTKQFWKQFRRGDL